MANANWLSRMFGGRKSTTSTGPFDVGKTRAGLAPAARSLNEITQDSNPGSESILLDDYIVESLLGEGGMGTVHLVRSRSSGQRFAIKRLRLPGELARRGFLDELQTWIDLPDHANLTACRFFRSVGDDVVIFAEYVEGGSLASWIRNQRLTLLEHILDVAVQFAWSLHVLHEIGLVHGDVKPANVLMTPQELAELTDFGIARGRESAGLVEPSAAGRSIFISSGGMTPAYCSPEQAETCAMKKAGVEAALRPKLTRRTDVWSWAVSVLEMFTGQVTWVQGNLADAALTEYLKAEAGASALPRMPTAVAQLLNQCLQRHLEDRPQDMAIVVDVLQEEFYRQTGKPYSRKLPPVPCRVQRTSPHDRRTTTGAQWDDPRIWLAKALRAAGRIDAKAESLTLRRQGSRQAQAIGDLVVYEEARSVFEQLVVSGRHDVRTDLADLCANKALVHENMGDFPGALSSYDRAIDIYERLVAQKGFRKLEAELAAACVGRASAMHSIGDLQGAIRVYDRALEIYGRLVEKGGHKELSDKLASTCRSKAVTVMVLGDIAGAVDMYNRAIAIYERAMEQDDRWELANELANACMNKANAVCGLGDAQGALSLYDRAIGIYDRLTAKEGHRECANDLAMACMNKATKVADIGDLHGAVILFDRALAIMDSLVAQDGRMEVASNVAQVCMNKAVAMQGLGDVHGAVGMFDRALGIWERLVEREGRKELGSNLGQAYVNKAAALASLGDLRTAAELLDRGITVWDRLVEQEGRRELEQFLITACLDRSRVLKILGDLHGAVRLYDRAISYFERVIAHEGLRGVGNMLALVYASKGLVVKDLGDLPGAVAMYDRALGVWDLLAEHGGRKEFTGVRVVASRALLLAKLGEMDRARADARQAVALFRAEIHRSACIDLQNEFNGMLRDLAHLL